MHVLNEKELKYPKVQLLNAINAVLQMIRITLKKYNIK